MSPCNVFIINNQNHIMKKLIFTLLFVSVGLACAQEPEKVPPDQVQKIATKIIEQLGDLADAQIKVDPDPDQGDALKAGEVGLLVLPDKKLTAEMISKAGEQIVPVGQLYLKQIAPAKGGKATPNGLLRIVTISEKDQEHKLPLCLLGARKRDGKLELVIFGKGKEPINLVTLRESQSSSSAPIEVSGKKQDDESASITLSILGKYKATFVVMKQAD